MELAPYLKKAAENSLQYEPNASFPRQLTDTDFYLAEIGDASIVGHDSIKFGEKEYKIGPQKTN